MKINFTILFCCLGVICGYGQPFQLSSPKVTTGDILFASESFLEAELAFDGVALKYTSDGSIPTAESKPYDGRIKVSEDMTVSVSAFHDNFLASAPYQVRFIKIDKEIKIKSLSIDGEVNEQYLGNSEKTLFDLEKGSTNFADGKWLGFKGQDVGLDINLENSISEFSVLVSTMTNTASWIMGPGKVSLQVWNTSSEKYETVDEVSLPNLEEDITLNTQFITLKAVVSKPINKCRILIGQVKQMPEWHPGNHENTWIFLDEIIVK